MLKKSLSHPPNPGAPRRACSHAVFSHRSDPQRGPGRLTTRRRAQTWCSLFVAPCAPEGTLPVFTRCGLAERTFEHLAWRALIVSDIQTSQIPVCQQNFSTNC